MILGDCASGTLPFGVAMLSSSTPTTEVGVDFGHAFLLLLATVVASYFVVEVLPDPLDAIVIRAIGRQKVQLYFALAGRQPPTEPGGCHES